MAHIATHPRPSYPWRRIIFVGVAALLAIVFLLVFGGLFAALSPWLPPDAADPGAVIHRWHDAQWGALAGVLFGGSLLALTRRPLAQPLVLQFLAIAATLVAIIRVGLVAPGSALFLLPLLLAFAAYPAPRDLLDRSRPQRLSFILLALTAAAATLLAPDIGRSFQLQRLGADAHAQQGHWAGAIALELVLILAGLLSATKRPGWRALSVVTGLAFIYLGLAALATPNYAGSWGASGGIVATLGGWAFIGAMLWETRRARGEEANTHA
jgi:hypothetical protein